MMKYVAQAFRKESDIGCFTPDQKVSPARLRGLTLEVLSGARRGPLPTKSALFASAWDRTQDLLFKGSKPLPLGPTPVGKLSYSEGKESPYKKSEPIPEPNNEPVKVVVVDSIQDVVLKSCILPGCINVLLEFYAPWCGHCKKLAPILDELAVSYEKDSDVIIAKFDATSNDVPSDFDVKYYPTLYFKTASGKILPFDEDERTKESFTAFIEKNRDKTEKQDSGKDEL